MLDLSQYESTPNGKFLLTIEQLTELLRRTDCHTFCSACKGPCYGA